MRGGQRIGAKIDFHELRRHREHVQIGHVRG
jgi:hypothetical protein